jgi:hypothetical protein
MSSIGADSSLASPTTATNEASSSTPLSPAPRAPDGDAWESTPGSASAGRKKSRCRTVCTNTNTPYSSSAQAAAKTSWEAVNSGLGLLVVNRGTTRQSAARVATVASAVAEPSALKTATFARRAPMVTARPTMTVVVIMTAAKTVSLARVAVLSGSPEIISVTIRATSMTVTATASTREPNGSPTRWATTSAWCTADSTAATSSAPPPISTTVGGVRTEHRDRRRRARDGYHGMPVP